LKIAGGHIEGTLFGVDLTLANFKPVIVEGANAKYPIDPGDLDPLDAASQRFPRLVIE
jgi:hypothetical protein